MLFVFSPIFVADIKINFVYNFVAPLTFLKYNDFMFPILSTFQELKEEKKAFFLNASIILKGNFASQLFKVQ